MIIDTSNALAAPGSSRGYACLSVALRSIAGSAAAPWPGDGRTSGAAGVPRRPLPRAFVPLSADSGSAPKLPAPGAPALRSSSRRWLAGARRVRSGPARRWGETPVGGRRGPRPRPSRAGGCLRVGTARYRAVAAARARRACRGRGSSPSPPPFLSRLSPTTRRPPSARRRVGWGGARSRPVRGVPSRAAAPRLSPPRSRQAVPPGRPPGRRPRPSPPGGRLRARLRTRFFGPFSGLGLPWVLPSATRAPASGAPSPRGGGRPSAGGAEKSPRRRRRRRGTSGLATSDQTWRPAEFKHISQRRKRN